MTRRRSALAAIALAGVTAMVATGAISAASDDPGRGRWDGASQLVGTWDVTVTIPNPPPGLPPVQKSLATFNEDGTTVESANAPTAARGASHGAWERIGPNLFAMTRVFFRFNPQTGAYLGTQKINATVRVSPDGETFAAVSFSELRDAEGNLVLAGLRATAAAARMHPQRIADQP